MHARSQCHHFLFTHPDVTERDEILLLRSMVSLGWASGTTPPGAAAAAADDRGPRVAEAPAAAAAAAAALARGRRSLTEEAPGADGAEMGTAAAAAVDGRARPRPREKEFPPTKKYFCNLE